MLYVCEWFSVSVYQMGELSRVYSTLPCGRWDRLQSPQKIQNHYELVHPILVFSFSFLTAIRDIRYAIIPGKTTFYDLKKS